jgi:phosphate starvation-inducible PhoH-like protein
MPKINRKNKKDFKSFEQLESFKNDLKPNEVPVKTFHLDFKHGVQRLAWNIYQQHDILFMLGPAGTGKTFLAMAFAIEEIINKSKTKIVLTRPVIEAGEKLGYLPGTFDEKINPYMMPLWDAISKICSNDQKTKDYINKSYEIAPLAYMRGRTFDDSVAILDEAQNCTMSQLKLFLTRMGQNTKMIVTGDPKQSDLYQIPDLVEVVRKLESVRGIGMVNFNEDCIVRHPLVGEILRNLEK